MALELNGFITRKDGCLPLDVTTVTTDYVGGQPLCILPATGVSVCKTINAVGFLGLARNDRSVDAVNGNATYISAPAEVVIGPSLASDGVTKTYPYGDSFSAYAVGDELSLNTSGKWVRTSTPGAGAKFLLLVVAIESDERLRVQLVCNARISAA